MSLSLNKIRYFIAAADAGQISLAGIQLGISQSAVTAAIQQLEEQLGVMLLSRGQQGVALTPEGARFLQLARNVMASVNEAVRTPLSEDTTLSGRVRVGVTYTVAGYFLPRHHARFARIYPRIELELIEWPREAIERALLDGSLDLAVMLTSNLRNRREIAHDTLIRSHRRLWVPVEHSLMQRETITLADIAEEPYVMLTVDEADQTADAYWQPTGLRPKTIFTTSSVEAVRSMVAAGMGVTVLSDMVYRPWSLEGQRIDTRSVAAEIPTMDVGLAWVLGRPLSVAAKLLYDFLSSTFNGAGSALSHGA